MHVPTMALLDQCRVNNQAQSSLVDTRNPLARAGNQVKKAPMRIVEDCVQGSCCGCICCHLRHPEAQARFARTIKEHLVASAQLAQIPEDRGRATRAVQVPIDDGTAHVSGIGTVDVPAHSRLLLSGRDSHGAACILRHTFNGRVSIDTWNEQAHTCHLLWSAACMCRGVYRAMPDKREQR